jgi:hypothetical protein
MRRYVNPFPHLQANKLNESNVGRPATEAATHQKRNILHSTYHLGAVVQLPLAEEGACSRSDVGQSGDAVSLHTRRRRVIAENPLSEWIRRRAAPATISGGVPEDADQPIPRRIWTQRSSRPRLRLAYARPEFRKTPWDREERPARSRDGYSLSKSRRARSVFAAPETEGGHKNLIFPFSFPLRSLLSPRHNVSAGRCSSQGETLHQTRSPMPRPRKDPHPGPCRSPRLGSYLLRLPTGVPGGPPGEGDRPQSHLIPR